MGKMDKMEEKAHALLSASSSHRWLECTPSARIEERYPDEETVYALEGTVAHAMAAMKLKQRLGRNYEEEEQELQGHEDLITGEMEECTGNYADFVYDRYRFLTGSTPAGKVKPTLDVEKRLDYSAYVKEGFGTGDAVIVCHDHLEVIDFKYGKGVAVKADHNTQMMLYALGAILEYDYACDIRNVLMTIYQPRVNNISASAVSCDELAEWADDVLAPLAAVAYRGLGGRKSGEWCRFCKAKGDCPRLATDSTAYYMVNPSGVNLTPEGYLQNPT